MTERSPEQLIQAIYAAIRPDGPATVELYPSDRKAIAELLGWPRALKFHRGFVDQTPERKRGYVEYVRREMAGK